MINIRHLLKVTAIWISIVYVVCYAGVAVLPSSRMMFMRYALHAEASLGPSVITLTTFISGLIIWNAVAILVIGLFAVLFNSIKK